MIFPKFSTSKANVLSAFLSLAFVGVCEASLTIPASRAFYNPATQTITLSIIHPLLTDTNQPKELTVKYFDDTCAVEVTAAALATLDTDMTGVPLGDSSGLYQSTVSNTLAVLSAVTSPALFVVEDLNNPQTPTNTLDDTGAYRFCVEYTLMSSVGILLDRVRYDVELISTLNGEVEAGVDVTTEIDTDGGEDVFTARAFLCSTDTSSPPVVTELDPTQQTYFFPSTVTICVESSDYPEASITDIASFGMTLDFNDDGNIVTGDGDVEKPIYSTGSFLNPAAYVAGLECSDNDGVETCAFTYPLDEDFFTSITNNQFDPNDNGSDTARLTASGTMVLRFGTGRRLRRVLTEFVAPASVELSISSGASSGADQVESGNGCNGLAAAIPFGWGCAFMEMVTSFMRGFMDLLGRLNPF